MANIIDIHKKGPTLEVQLCCAFNLWIRNILESRLHSGITKLRLDMSRSNRIDSEGVIFLHRWQRSGKELELINPPPVLFEILDILELTDMWDLEAIVTR